MRAGTCVVLVALGHLAQQVGNGGGDGLGAVPQVLGALLHLQGEQGLHPTQTAPKPRAQHPVCPLTVSPGRGLSLPSLAAALASCRSLSRLCTKPSAESISRGPQASCACGGEKEERFCRELGHKEGCPSLLHQPLTFCAAVRSSARAAARFLAHWLSCMADAWSVMVGTVALAAATIFPPGCQEKEE